MSFEMLNRRAALAGAAVALAGSALAMPARAADAAADVAAAVEALRVAMLAGDGKTLTGLVWDQLVYVHSDAHFDTKESFLKSLDGTNAFGALTFSDQIVTVVGDDAIVRHTFDCINNLPGGKTSTAHIRVLQVWKLDKGAWKLLARQSTPLKA